MKHPFEYPVNSSERKHAPKGYINYTSYKPWLRDEFDFRCPYCLAREKWEHDGTNQFGVEHLKPKGKYPLLENIYSNLTYCCNRCNNLKGQIELDEIFLREHIQFKDNGKLNALTKYGEKIIDIFNLNDDKLIEYREKFYKTIIHLYENSHDIYLKWMGFPEDLPDLSKQKPPLGNDKPNGIKKSYFELKKQDKLQLDY